MDDTPRSVQVAIGLMRMALALLDKAEERIGAEHLQHAIDTILKHRPMKPGAELSPEDACLLAGIPLSAP